MKFTITVAFFFFSLSFASQNILVPDHPVVVTQTLNSTIYFKLEQLSPSNYYEVRISYPAINPTIFSMEVIPIRSPFSRDLLNTEKVMFTTNENNVISGMDKVEIKVTARNEGVAAKLNFDNRNVTYEIVLETLFFNAPYSIFPLVIITIIVSILLYIFLPHILRSLVKINVP